MGELVKLPIDVTLDMRGISGASVSKKESGITNGIITNSGSRIVLTQRPSIDIFEDASALSAGAKGRAIYYWDTDTNRYIVNDDTIYRGGYATSAQTITTGTDKCKFAEVGGKLVLLDVENNQGWVISPGGSVVEITDVDFPPKDTGLTSKNRDLVHGGSVLDGYLFVMFRDGSIYNCDLENPTSWNALNFINAEREEDEGVYLGKHHDHIVAFGSRTIEFFYDAANTSGSPLSRRSDIFHNIGCADGLSVWENGDITCFLGSDPDGNIGGYMMINFVPTKISSSSMDSLFTQAISKDGYKALGSGFSAQGQKFYIITFYTDTGGISTESTYVYDIAAKKWYEWETVAGGLTQFPVVDWQIRSGSTTRVGEGIYTNGDLFTVKDDLTPLDSVGEQVYVEGADIVTDVDISFTATQTISNTGTKFSVFSAGETITVSGSTSNDGTYTISTVNGGGSSITTVEATIVDETFGDTVTVQNTPYVADGYITDSVSSGAAITMLARLGQFDGGTNGNKTMHKIRPVMDKTSSTQNMTIRWANGNEDSFTTGRTVDCSKEYDYARRCGRFNRRNVEIEYSGSEQIHVEELEADISVGNL